jgi:signal transduction histidine kinase
MALLRWDLRKDGGGDKAITRVDNITRSVRELSHRLHPAALKLAGLVPSLRALEQEHLQSGLSVQFVHEDVPESLSAETSLCLFRVVQETLQNAAKHSGASKTMVMLNGTNDRLLLTVTDNGAGFDVEQAWGKGLGLISIRERVEACRGTVAIESGPGRGTRFTVDVPI